ncbi:MAG: hypothetical protein GX332_09205 [Alcaligenaceae bacterium]|nr:hypothetical protein [Alcaligenaceae bacterium]
MKPLRTLLFIAMIVAMTGCGYKGPLTLPEFAQAAARA